MNIGGMTKKMTIHILQIIYQGLDISIDDINGINGINGINIP